MGRQRSESLSGQLLRKSTKLKKVQPCGDIKCVLFKVNGCQLTSVYDLREGEEGSADFYDDDWAFRRPRSNSSVVDCYELSPQSGNVIVLDKSIKVDRAFSALCEQNVRAGLVWDASQRRITSIVTLTDFLKYLREDASQCTQGEIGDLITDNSLVTVFADMKVIEACEQLCLHRVHRIIVREPQSGDILYLLTIKRVLQAIHKQNRSLHFAQWLSSPIKESGVGTWESTIHSVSLEDCLNDVVEKLLGHHLSSLPVINSDGQAIDVVTKSDLAMALIDMNAHQTFFADTTVGTVLGHRPPAVFVRPNDPVGKVLDVLLEAHHMRCVFIVDDHITPIACVSQSDVISHLIYDEVPFQKQKSPSLNS
ncbi:CBS domain protein [Ostertagia ostertagi]